MNTKEYGHHASGYRKADGGPSKRFMRGLAICASRSWSALSG